MHLITIKGAQGVGRTRATKEVYLKIKETLPNAECAYVAGEGSAQGEADEEPFAAAKVLLRFFSLGKRHDALKAQAKAAESVQGHAEGLLKSLPGAALLLGASSSASAEQVSLDQLMREVMEAIKRRADEAPLVFAIDDVHLIDQPTHELFRRLLSRLGTAVSTEHPIVLIQSVPLEAEPDEKATAVDDRIGASVVLTRAQP